MNCLSFLVKAIAQVKKTSIQKKLKGADLWKGSVQKVAP